MDEHLERNRLAALAGYGILDTPPEPSFDDITALTAALFDVPIALVSLVDRDRQWFKAKVGIDARETVRSVSFCHHAIQEDGVFLVTDASQDDRFRDNPLVTDDPKIRFYAGVPLRTPTGEALGTLCIIDRRERELGLGDVELLHRLAHEVEGQLERSRRSHLLATALASSRAGPGERETLVPTLAHELRERLSAIALVAMERQLGRSSGEDRDLAEILRFTEDAHRAIANALDISLARTSGLRTRKKPVDWTELLRSVRSLMAGPADRSDVELAVEPSPPGAVDADPQLLQRALVHLVENALRHAPAGTTVRLGAVLADGELQLRVADEGPEVSDEAKRSIARLGDPGGAVERHGLGLTFCAVAARAHEGRLGVEDLEPEGSVFVLALPFGPR